MNFKQALRYERFVYVIVLKLQQTSGIILNEIFKNLIVQKLFELGLFLFRFDR